MHVNHYYLTYEEMKIHVNYDVNNLNYKVHNRTRNN